MVLAQMESPSAQRAMLPSPPPNLTASAVTHAFLSLDMLLSTTLPPLPLAKLNVPRYIHVPPPIFWLTANSVVPPL